MPPNASGAELKGGGYKLAQRTIAVLAGRPIDINSQSFIEVPVGAWDEQCPVLQRCGHGYHMAKVITGAKCTARRVMHSMISEETTIHPPEKIAQHRSTKTHTSHRRTVYE